MSDPTIFTDTGALVAADYGDPVARISDLKGLNGSSRPALQASTALRPVYGRGPLAGRRNFFSRTDTMHTWVGYDIFREQTDQTNIYGDLFTRATYLTGTTRLRLAPEGGFVAGKSYSLSFVCKADTGNLACFGSQATSHFNSVVFDLSNGTIVNTGSGAWVVPALTLIESLGGGEYRCRFVLNASADSVAAVGLSDANLGDIGQKDTSILISSAQIEEGDTATPYQRVRDVMAFDITEPVIGAASPAYLRFDLSDDKMTHTFPNGFTGDVMLFGREGSWVEENVTIAPGGNLDIGPRAVTGGIPGTLDAIGDLVGWLPVGRVLSEQERQYMVDYYKERGAKGLLVPGPELIVNFDFSDGFTGWIYDDAVWEVVDGKATITTEIASAAIFQAPDLNPANLYFYRARTSYQIDRNMLGGALSNSSLRPYRRIVDQEGAFITEAVGRMRNETKDVAGIRFRTQPSETWVDWFSLRELRPQEEW